ncbi:MAG: HAMP domain-containing sensor histidine kinase [Anaerolineae bacterium]
MMKRRLNLRFPTSIRWRLPLSYALIALLATLSLGTVLLTTLRGYYAQREYERLAENANVISRVLTEMYAAKLSTEQMETQLHNLSFISQSRVQVLDDKLNVVLDTGDATQPHTIALGYDFRPQDIFTRIVDKNPLVGPVLDTVYAPPRWVGTIDITGSFKPENDLSLLPLRENGLNGETRKQFFIGVAGTPFGFGLNKERIISVDQFSDQTVRQPIMDDQHKLVGYVKLLEGPALGTEIFNGVVRALLSAGAVAIVLAATVGWFMSRQISQPLLALADMTGHMAEGNLAVRVRMERQDEFGLLARSFNHMAGRLENTVTTLRRFVADAAHELHTPITALHANLELAATEPDHNASQQFVLKAQEQLRRLEALTSSLLDLSRLEGGDSSQERSRVDVTVLIREVSEVYASRAEQMGLLFEFDVPDMPVVVSANEAQLRRVVGNLLDNAVKFTPENGKVCIGLARQGTQVNLWVQDNGIGIPAEDLPLLFNRFRRGRNAAAYPGSGLGLAIIKAIVERHGGQISAEPLTQGTRFLLQLPAGT